LIGALPDHERPLSTYVRPACKRAPNGSSNALLTACRVSGCPASWYCVVFQVENSGWSATSIRPTHLMFATPTQPGTTTRSGAP
jgi:hypothetical protein